MPKNDSVDFFLRFLRERFKTFRSALTDFLNTLSLDDRKRKVESAKNVVETLDHLKRAMSTGDHPTWIGPLEAKLQWYAKVVASQGDAGLQVIQTIMQLHQQIASQTWDFADSSANAIDFDAIYQEYYRESRVPELFDELVAQLEAIIEGGHIDSLQTIKALQKLIATVKKNARGDFFATRGACEFTQLFFKNYALEVLESIPVVKEAVKALRKTMSELDIEMSQVNDKVRKRLVDSAQADLSMLEYRSVALPAPKDDIRDDDAR